MEMDLCSKACSLNVQIMVCMSVEYACVRVFILGAWCIVIRYRLDTYIQIYMSMLRAYITDQNENFRIPDPSETERATENGT